MFKRKFIIITFIVIILVFGVYNITHKRIDDYYDLINKEYINNIVLEDNKVGISEFIKYQEEVDKEVDEITKKLINNDIKVNNLYNMLKDKNRSNKIIYKYLELIDNSNNINEFINNTVTIENELNVDIFTKVTIMKDIKDNRYNIVYFEPITFDFSSPAYMYNDSNFDSYASIFKGYQIKFMKESGYNTKKAREISSKIFNMEKDIASKSLKFSEINNIENLYNKISKKELQNIYTNINIDNYLKLKGLENEDYFSIVDINNYKAFNSYLNNNNLDILKEYVKFKVLEEYAPFLTINYAKLVSEINNTTLELNKEYDIEKDALDIIETYYNDVIEREYVLNNYNENNKIIINNMIKDIIDYYKNDINNLEWMSKYTKENAIKKLDNLKVNIYKDNFKIISDKYVIDTNNSLVENIININKIVNKENLRLLNTDDNVSLIGETVVNAYYNPQDNSINFPTSFNKFLNENHSYYENLGTVGMIIAHEITHAFDNNGAKFDYNGNLNNWWNKDDYEKFNELMEKVINYYNNYKINGIYVNGSITVGENIADLGSINCITEIANLKGASKDDYKVLFSSFAKMWRSKYLDSYQKILLTSDTHSPDKIRVNATLSSNKYFYDVYDINYLDKMYKNQNERVKVW